MNNGVWLRPRPICDKKALAPEFNCIDFILNFVFRFQAFCYKKTDFFLCRKNAKFLCQKSDLKRIKAPLERDKKTLPRQLKILQLFDQKNRFYLPTTVKNFEFLFKFVRIQENPDQQKRNDKSRKLKARALNGGRNTCIFRLCHLSKYR